MVELTRDRKIAFGAGLIVIVILVVVFFAVPSGKSNNEPQPTLSCPSLAAAPPAQPREKLTAMAADELRGLAKLDAYLRFAHEPPLEKENEYVQLELKSWQVAATKMGPDPFNVTLKTDCCAIALELGPKGQAQRLYVERVQKGASSAATALGGIGIKWDLSAHFTCHEELAYYFRVEPEQQVASGVSLVVRDIELELFGDEADYRRATFSKKEVSCPSSGAP